MRVLLKHQRLAQEVARSRLTQNRWAQKLELDRGHFSQLVNGKRLYPNAATRLKLLKGFDLPFDELFEVEGVEAKGQPAASPKRRSMSPTQSRILSSPDPSWRTPMVTLLQNLRFTFRALRKSPAFAVTAILTLALGIGANTAIFSVVNAVLLSPLPFPSSERLVRVWSAHPEKGSGHSSVSPHDLDDWRRMTDSFEAIGAYPNVPLSGLVLTGDGEPREVNVSYVSEGFFEAFASPTRMGRPLSPQDQIEGRNAVVVISHAFWQNHFGGQDKVVGQDLTLNSTPFTIIGVMPAGFSVPSRQTQAWMPLSLIPESGVPRRRDVRWLAVVARLKSGVELRQAEQELSQTARSLAEQHPAENANFSGITMTPLHEVMTGNVSLMLWVVLSAVGLVLLIGCANVANLSLAWTEKRRRELAIRQALGAGGWRVALQIVTENLVLALAGGVLGLFVGMAALRILLRIAPDDLGLSPSIQVDSSVLFFTAALSILTGLVFGLFPALRAARADLGIKAALQDGHGPGLSPARNRYRWGLVVAEMSLVTVLAVFAGLILKSYSRLLAADPGFRPQGVLTLRINAPAYKYQSSEAIRTFFQDVLQQVRQSSSVEAASLIRPLPLGAATFAGESWTFRRPVSGGTAETPAVVRFVSSDYFQTMGIPLLAGEDLRAAEKRRVTVVNQAFADRYWPGETAVEKTILAGPASVTVVGVVGNIRQVALNEPARPAAYVPINLATRRGMTLAIRTQGDPYSALAEIRTRIRERDPDQPIIDIASMEDLVGTAQSNRRFSALLLGLFALLALTLAAIGIYGVLTYLVNERVREIGVRISLGAQAGDVLKLVVRQGMGMAAIGLIIGLAAAWGLSRTISGLLFEVPSGDPATFVMAGAVLVVASLAACAWPAYRASQVDPIQALRCE